MSDLGKVSLEVGKVFTVWNDSAKYRGTYLSTRSHQPSKRLDIEVPVSGYSDPLHLVLLAVGGLQLSRNLLVAEVVDHLHGVVVDLSALHVDVVRRLAAVDLKKGRFAAISFQRTHQGHFYEPLLEQH